MQSLKKFFICLIILLGSIPARSQNNELDSILDAILFEDEELVKLLTSKPKYHFLYWRTNYNNKTYYAGREIGDKQYNLSGQMYYFNYFGFYLGAAGAWYSQLDPHYNSTIVSPGINSRSL